MTTRRAKRVLVVGSITRDTNIFDGVAEHSYGGTALYAARTYAEFGIDVRLVTRLAPDDRAAIAAQLPHADLIAQPSAVTTTFENSYGPSDERTQRVTAVAAPIEHRADYFADVDWLHLGPLHPADLASSWLSEHAGKPVGLDLQGFARRIADERVIADVDARIVDLLPRLHWLKASRSEWQPLLAHLHLAATSRPTRGAIESLVTDGAAGGDLLRGEARDTHWVAAPPVDHCDPTGAGDVFFAAYLVHRAGLGADAALAAKNAARITSAFLLKRREHSER
ncbi:MAG TPA: PfkB family carbohydrate kinase [Pseudomonadales bacterium]|nr:PfkB family carbohydrate kinase [Pseudomonadales bacterium]